MGVKKRKKTIDKKTFLLFIFLGIILLVLCILRFVPNLTNYKVDSRIDTLKEYNEKYSDMSAIGWLKVQGTNIDYPIIKNYSNVEYKKDDDVQYLWENGIMSSSNKINYVMGHNIMNLSANPLITEKNHVRFEQLLSFTYPEFVEKNKYIQLTIDGEDYLYKIFAVSYPKAMDVSSNNNPYLSDEDVNSYIKEELQNSIYDFSIDVSEKDQILSLITCTRMFGTMFPREFVVDARLVRKGEDTGNYKVVKTKKYKEVEERMKGESINNET